MKKKNLLRKKIAMLLLVLCFSTKLLVAQTVLIYATGTAGSYKTGSVNSTGTKNDGNMITINTSTNRGWGYFDLTTIPVGSTVLSATITFTTFSSTSSSATNNIYGFHTLPDTTGGTNLYGLCANGTSFIGASWTANATQTLTLNATGISYLNTQAGLSGSERYVDLGFVRGSSNTYNIYGYPGTTAQQPLLTITYGNPCSGTPTAGAISGPASACSGVSFNLTNTGATTGTNIKYSWQSSASAGGPWTNLNNTSAVVSPFSVSQTAVTYYRFVDTCITSGQSAISSNVLTVNMNAPAACYCTPTYTTGCTSNDNINDFSLPGDANPISQLATGCSTGAYGDYTALTPVTLTQGNNYNGSMSSTYGSSENAKFWIDFNDNGVFESSDSVGIVTGVTTTGVPFTIGIPVTATTGIHRMRVRLVFATAAAVIDPCNSYSYGEVHDYRVNILATTPCSGTPSVGTVSGPAAVASAASFNLVNTGTSNTGSGIRYAWQSSASAGGPWTNLNNTSSLATPYSTSQTSPTYYRMVDTCTNSTLSAISNSIYVDMLVAPASCATNTSPANGATGVTPNPSITFNWSAVPNATSYTVFFSGTNNPPNRATDSVATVTTNTASLIGAFASNTLYYWSVIPKNVLGEGPNCISAAATSFTTAAGPANDACAGATNLTVSNGYCASPVLGTLNLADSTTGLGGASCQGSALKYDVWYKATVPATGNITVQTSAVNTTVTDMVLVAYSGTCGALTAIGCDDDGNPDASPSSLHSKLGLTGRTPGEVIYYRVLAYSTATNIGAFAICAFDTSASVLPAVSVGVANGCKSATPVVIDSAFKYTWATFKDATGNIIAQIYPNGNLLGNTTASFYLNSGAVRQSTDPIYYLDRNITITPTTQPTTAVTTRLFLTNAELSALSAAVGGAGVTRGQLNTTKTTQTCATSAAVVSGGTYQAQSASSAYGTDHSIDVSNTSFSTFYMHGGSIALPVKIEYFRGTKQANSNLLDWKVSCTNTPSATLTLERSADARSFSSVYSINATALRCLQPFSYTDAVALPGMNYYRLKMKDASGAIAYSSIVALLNKDKGLEIVNITPNPVTEGSFKLNISAAQQTKMEVVITDIQGRIMSKQNVTLTAGFNAIDMNVSNLAKGTYQLFGNTADGKTKTLGFVKQ